MYEERQQHKINYLIKKNKMLSRECHRFSSVIETMTCKVHNNNHQDEQEIESFYQKKFEEIVKKLQYENEKFIRNVIKDV